MAVWERFRPVREELGDNLKAPLRLALGAATLLTACVGAWMAAAAFDTVVEISAVVVRDQSRQPVRLSETAELREILIGEGEEIARGAPLLRIAEASQAVALQERRLQVFGLEAAAAALTAELTEADALVFPEALTRVAASNAAARESLESRRAAFEARRSAAADRIVALEAERVSAEQALEQARAAGDDDAEKRAAAALSFAQEALDIHVETRRQAAREELETVTRRLLSVRNALADREAAAVVETVLAPASGRAVGVRAALAGQVVEGGEIVLEIQPTEPRLVADAQLGEPAVFSEPLTPGRRAEMRVQSRPGVVINGVVVAVEGDLGGNSGAEGASGAISRIAVAPDDPGALPLGEPVTIEISTGGKAPLAHLLGPLLRLSGVR